MTISFSGLASGMDTSSWVEALVSVKQQEITKMESNKAVISEAQSVLSNIKSYFNSFQNLLLNITDAKKNSSRDLFAQNLAESSNVSILTGSAGQSAENTTYNIEVKQLANSTEVNSGINIIVPNTVSNVATMQSKLLTLADENNPVTTGEIVFCIDGHDRKISIGEDSTIESFIDSLDSIGIAASYDENTGIFSLGVSTQKPGASKALTTESGVANGNTKLKDLGITDDNDCKFDIVTYDEHDQEIRTTIDTLTKESTINDLFTALSARGITGSINEDGVISLSSTGFKGRLSEILGFSDSSMYVKSDATGIIDALGLQDVNYGYKTDKIEIVTVKRETGEADRTSKLSELGVTNDQCKFTIKHANGSTEQVNLLTSSNTLGDLIDILEGYDIHASFNKDGTLTFTSDRLGNVFEGDLSEALGFSVFEYPQVSLAKMTSTAIVNSTIETVVNRDSTLSQIGAVLNASDNLVIRECDGGEVVENGVITSLNGNSTVQDLFDTLTAFGITGTIVDGVISLTSTSGNYVDGNIATNIGILHPIMETYYTTASMTMTSSGNINTATTLGALGMSSDGSVIIDSPLYGVVSVNIAKELTVQGFCDKINDSNYGIHAEIVGNKVQLSELSGSGAFVKGMSSVLQSVLKLNVGEDFSYDSTTINVYTNTDSGYLEYDDTGVIINANTVISSLNGYTQGNGQMLLHTVDDSTGIDTVTTIMVDSSLTLDEFINNPIVGLAQYGLSGQILSDGKAYITADSHIYLEQVAGGSNLLSKLNMSPVQKTWVGDHISGINALEFSRTITTTATATKDTALSTWDYSTIIDGHTETYKAEGTFIFKANDYYKTVEIEADDTFSSLIDKLAAVGIKASLSRGVFYIESGYDNVEYVEDESSSDLAKLIHMNTHAQNLGNYAASSRPVMSTITTNEEKVISAVSYADMDTKLGVIKISNGVIGQGGSLTIYRNGVRKTIEEIDPNWTFRDLQTKLASNFGDLRISFKDPNDPEAEEDGILRIYSTDPTANISIGATSDTSNFVAITGLYSSDNNELSSSRAIYKMNENTTLGENGIFRTAADQGSTLESLGITNGNFNITQGEITKTISITDGETIGSLLLKINNQFNNLNIKLDEKGCLEDGVLKIYSTNGTNFQVQAASSNASNFINIVGLDSTAGSEKVGTKTLYQSVRAGSFKVGNADIYITADDDGNITTTMSDIVSQINAANTKDTANSSLATAYWDGIEGKLVIKSTITGASAVNIESGTTNFTNLLGLTNGDNLIMSSQKIGKNAILTINGTTYTSLKNDVTSEATGITGLTINLKGLTEGSAVQLTVKRDTESLTNAMQNVVDGYNELISNIDAAISKDGKLKNQSILKLIRNNIRTKMTSSDFGALKFTNLASIGIKSAEASAGNISTSDSTITMLSFNKEEFLKAFESDEEAVKALLVGGTDNEGIFEKVYNEVFQALSSNAGFFPTAEKSYKQEKEKIDKKIVNGTAAIARYRAQLEKKFSAMDIMIAGMQNQYKSFLT